jgi:hypothetical protein
MEQPGRLLGRRAGAVDEFAAEQPGELVEEELDVTERHRIGRAVHGTYVMPVADERSTSPSAFWAIRLRITRVRLQSPTASSP